MQYTRSHWLQSFAAIAIAFSFVFAILTLWLSSFWPVSIFEILILLTAAIVVMHGETPNLSASYPLFVLMFAALWGLLQLATGHTAYRYETGRAVIQWLTWAAVYYLGLFAFRSATIRRAFLDGLVWFGFLLASEAIVQAYVFPEKIFALFPAPYPNLVMGPVLYHTHYAVIVGTILPIALYKALHGRIRPYLYLGIAIILFISVVVSASRGGLIIVSLEAVAVFVLLYLRRDFRRGVMQREAGAIAVTLVAIAGIFVGIAGYGAISMLLRPGSMLHGRVEYALSTIHMIAHQPWMGFGLGTWSTVYPAYAMFDPWAFVNQAHCDWLQWTAEGGLPLGILMVSLFVWTVPHSIRSIWGIGAIAAFVHAIFDYPFSRPAIGALPILIMAMVAAQRAAGARSQSRLENESTLPLQPTGRLPAVPSPGAR